MSKISTESPTISQDSKTVPVTEQPKETGKYICHSEVVRDGATIHYLYNPTEKDASKAWKMSKDCSK